MTQEANTKAAALHDVSAKSHRSAADAFGKKDEVGGLGHAKRAQTESEAAHAASAEAHKMSAATHTKK
jgi:hypothetical protein